MEILKIEFPTELNKIKDIEDDNIDVFVELNDGFTYTLVVTTPKNLYTQMKNEEVNFIPAGPPFVIVNSLTEGNIINAIQTFVNDNAYWLKLYFLAGEFDTRLMDKMLEQVRKENKDISG